MYNHKEKIKLPLKGTSKNPPSLKNKNIDK